LNLLSGSIASLETLQFSDLDEWLKEDHSAALSCFRVSAKRMAAKPYSTKKLGIDADLLAIAGKAALALEDSELRDGERARRFFEDWFLPHRIIPHQNQAKGFVTGYFEPETEASPVQTARFQYPVLSKPDDLVTIDDDTRPDHMDPTFFFAKKNDSGLSEYFDREAIENGVLAGQGLEIFWLESRVELFFIHIQGSARLKLPNGETKRISYSAKSGHPFTAIGKLLIEKGALTLETVSMQSIRQWLLDHPDQADGMMRRNRSYIFFQEIDHPQPDMGPVAAAGIPLTPGRSLAVDHRLQTFGTPIWISTRKPLPGSSVPFNRLMMAQDTGSAIVGPVRGDLYMGTGYEAGEIAGRIKQEADFVAFIPRPR
jgi:membrane-bound lytic murein transglycosylase A